MLDRELVDCVGDESPTPTKRLASTLNSILHYIIQGISETLNVAPPPPTLQ